MSIKYIFSDMDNTLIGPDQKLSKRNIETIKEVIKNGVHFVLDSGRTPVNMNNYAKELGIFDKEDEYMICGNGTYIVNTKLEALYSNYADIHDLITITNYLDKLEGINFYYYACPNSHFGVDVKTRKVYQDGDFFSLTYEDALKEIKNNEICKMSVSGDNKNLLLEVATTVKEITNGRMYGVLYSHGGLDIMNVGTSKGLAINTLSKKIGFSLDETLCIGDNYNDLDMAKFCKTVACPKNAVEDFKQKANYISPFICVEDAVADILNKLILK